MLNELLCKLLRCKHGLYTLVGKDCVCEFDLEFHEWPIPGYPAFVHVVDVVLPMVKMRPMYGGQEIWINWYHVKTLKELHNEQRSGESEGRRP